MFNWIVNDILQNLEPFNCVQKKKMRQASFKIVINKIYLDLHFLFLNRGIVLWIELLWPENLRS